MGETAEGYGDAMRYREEGVGRERAVAGAKAGERGSGVGAGSQKVGEGEQCPLRTG